MPATLSLISQRPPIPISHRCARLAPCEFNVDIDRTRSLLLQYLTMVRGISSEAARAVRHIMLSDLHRGAQKLCERPKAESMAARASGSSGWRSWLGHAMLAVLWWWLQPGDFRSPSAVLVPRCRANWRARGCPSSTLGASSRTDRSALAALAGLSGGLVGGRGDGEGVVSSQPGVEMAGALGGGSNDGALDPGTSKANGRSNGWYRAGRAALFGSITASVLAGVFLVCTQRVRSPATHPSNPRFPEFDRASSSSALPPGRGSISRGRWLVQSFDGSIVVPSWQANAHARADLAFSGPIS